MMRRYRLASDALSSSVSRIHGQRELIRAARSSRRVVNYPNLHWERLGDRNGISLLSFGHYQHRCHRTTRYSCKKLRARTCGERCERAIEKRAPDYAERHKNQANRTTCDKTELTSGRWSYLRPTPTDTPEGRWITRLQILRHTKKKEIQNAR